MININDNNRDNLIASCLIEAANVMSESYGAHGTYGKLLEEKYKKEKAKNDSLYNPDRKKEKDLKGSIEDDKRIRSNKNTGEYYAKQYPSGKGHVIYRNSAIETGDELLHKMYDRSVPYDSYHKRKLNEKINNRAKKAMGESVEEHLEFANLLLED